MTQSKDEYEYTVDLTNMNGTTDTITITSTPSSIGDIWIDTSMADSAYTVTSSWDINDLIVDTDTIDISNLTFDRVMFEDDMPDPQEIKRMCEEYPALEKVYENFKTVYKMVEQDWRGKNKADDDQFPF